MKTTQKQNDALDLFIPVALFLTVMIFFISTRVNYIKQDKIIQDKKKMMI